MDGDTLKLTPRPARGWSVSQSLSSLSVSQQPLYGMVIGSLSCCHFNCLLENVWVQIEMDTLAAFFQKEVTYFVQWDIVSWIFVVSGGDQTVCGERNGLLHWTAQVSSALSQELYTNTTNAYGEPTLIWPTTFISKLWVLFAPVNFRTQLSVRYPSPLESALWCCVATAGVSDSPRGLLPQEYPLCRWTSRNHTQQETGHICELDARTHTLA